tara:strand:+ start:2402 stop:2683 length:282 start_codon:yes stop_codon:yes gene_type:complete
MISKESQRNFRELMRAVSQGDISVVECKDKKGRDFQVLCALVHQPDIDEYEYIPFGFMLTPGFYPLMNRIEPPENLKGRWSWPQEQIFPGLNS